MFISTGIIAATLLLCIALGVMASRGHDMDMEQWTTGGRGFGTIFIFLLLAGEIYTTNAFLGVSGWAYGKGGAAFFNIQMINFVVAYWLTPKIWKYAKDNNLLTQSDFFVHAYGSRTLGILVACIGVLALIPYLVIQLKGLGIIVSEASYGAIPPALSVWIGTVSMVVYVMISGIRGSAWTATIKDLLILSVVLFIGIYLPIHYFGGFEPMWRAAEAAKPGFLALPERGLSASWYISTIILISFGFYMWPHTFLAVFSAKSGKALRNNAMLLPIYALFILFVLFAGTTAAVKVPGLTGGNIDLALFKISIATFDPIVVGFIGAAGLLAAIVPGSLLLMSAATLLIKNIYTELRPETTEKRTLILAKSMVPVVALVAVYATFQGGQAITLLLLMGYGMVTQFAPAVIGNFCKRNPFNLPGVFAGLVVGVAIVVSQVLLKWTLNSLIPDAPGWTKDLNVGLLALVINVVIAGLVSSLTRKSLVAVPV